MITHNFDIVANELIKLPKILETNVETLLRKIALSIANSVIMGTPVDTGKARGNWQVSFRNPIYDEIERKQPKGSKVALEAAKNVIINFKLKDKSMWISNNLPYINALNSGHSPQKPANIPGYIQRAVEGVYLQVESTKLL